MLVQGTWRGAWHPVQASDDQGRFIRQASTFRDWITPDGRPGPEGQPGRPAEPGRYRLYAALICPWASRVLLVRALKRLHDVIPVTIVEPELTDEGWRFATPDPELGARHMHTLYTAASPHHTGRATVPVLWDRVRGDIVNNESSDLIRMLDTGFDAFTDARLDLRPPDLLGEIEALSEVMYRRFNNGVYRAGFATTQAAYDEAARDVFGMLDALEARLGDGRAFLHGDRFTESDVRAFVTLVRFDAAYVGAFRLNLRTLRAYPRLFAYMRRVLALPGARETVNVDHIKRGYYSIRALNPTGIVPSGPIDPLGTSETSAASAC